jgi:hypothetical protein
MTPSSGAVALYYSSTPCAAILHASYRKYGARVNIWAGTQELTGYAHWGVER